MKKTYYSIITIVLLMTVCANGNAQTLTGNKKMIRNPFIPQLPRKEVIVEDNTSQQQTNTISNNNDNVKTPDQLTTSKTKQEDSPPIPIPIPQPNFAVTAVIWNTDRPQAIINGKVVDIGDQVDGFKIESIHQSGIEVSIRGVKLTVKP